MRYVIMHKASAQDEAGVPPTAQLIEQMGELIGQAVKDGVFLLGDGLHPSSRRWRVSCRRGEVTVKKGPYAGSHELPQAIAAIRVRNADEGLAWSKRFAHALGGDVDLEVGTLVEEWDLGGEKPDGDVPVRFLVSVKSDQRSEAGAALPAASQQALAKLLDESTRTEVLQYFETLRPSKEARRLLYRDHKRAVVDGPFAESKELIGGFCMMQLRTIDEVVAWVDRYARILGGNLEVDVRVVADAAPGGAA